ncbi:MAG: phage tail tip lysozyme [Pseudomonadota bacterium]|nr:phage tail tip lysozyme [Pseudomonadota bacterium]
MTVRQQQALAVFTGRYPLISAAAIVGNLSGESGKYLDSTVERPHADHGSGGIAEWRLGRKANLYAFAQGQGKPVTDLETQCLFLMHELDGPEYALLNAQLTKPGNRSIENLTANFCQIFERPNMALAHVDNRVANAKAVMNDARIAKVAIGSRVMTAGSLGVATVTYLQQGLGVGTLIFIIAAVAIGTVSAAAMKPRKDGPASEEEPTMPKTQSYELKAAFGALEQRLAAVPGEEFLTDLLAAMLAGRKMLDGALGRTADLIRARVQREAELMAQIPSGPVLGLNGPTPAAGIRLASQSDNVNYFPDGPER